MSHHPTADGIQAGEVPTTEPATSGSSLQTASSPPTQPPKRPSFSLLGDLPVELVYELKEHLDANTQAFLSQTNKAFCDYMGRDGRAYEHLAFLQTLLRSRPAAMLCHDCRRLHPRDENLARPLAPANREWVELKSFCRTQRFFTGYGTPYLAFSQVQLVMDRHFLSPAHGVPLAALVSHRFCKAQRPADCHSVMRTEPRVVADELVVKACSTIWRQDGDMEAFAAAMRSGHARICPHVTLDANHNNSDGEDDCAYHDEDQIQVRELADFDFDDFACPGVVGEIRGCRFCCTDYWAVIENRRASGGGWRLEVTTWQCFGAGRDPLDDKWLALVDDWYVGSWPRPQVTASHAPGSVRAAFEAAGRQLPLDVLEGVEEPDWNAPAEVVWDDVEMDEVQGDWLLKVD